MVVWGVVHEVGSVDGSSGISYSFFVLCFKLPVTVCKVIVIFCKIFFKIVEGEKKINILHSSQ